MSDPKYAYPHPAQGYYPPVAAPPNVPPPPRRKHGFRKGCLAALRFCCLIGDCCLDAGDIFSG
ncbi:unnamed protein product [Dovyalis caffra]|uniref:Cysteine-rich transmembrane domain-containing protein n=1 Tax=Dovyalis caffra TaxID=77055 RepID=A0AAV1QR30_9ROSI|nr:unnamed protein product [Dovyalis caffra]